MRRDDAHDGYGYLAFAPATKNVDGDMWGTKDPSPRSFLESQTFFESNSSHNTRTKITRVLLHAHIMAKAFRELIGVPPSTASTEDSVLVIIDAQNE